MKDSARTREASASTNESVLRADEAATPPASYALCSQVVAESEGMKRLLGFSRRIANSPASVVLVEGETGVGKEVIARLLHSEGPRKNRPFVAVNCAALPEPLFESELFGHEKGAFTGAVHRKKGLLEMADGGTLFLDEIGELPTQLQVKLLRVLEEQSYRRLGGEKEIRVRFRIVAATNANLRIAVQQRKFRLDLYHRLNVIQIQVPPLRERRDDILPLFHHFLRRYSQKFQRNFKGVDPQAAELLLKYAWPGNVRELRNVVERVVALEEGPLVSRGSLPDVIRALDSGTNGGVNRFAVRSFYEQNHRETRTKRNASENKVGLRNVWHPRGGRSAK